MKFTLNKDAVLSEKIIRKVLQTSNNELSRFKLLEDYYSGKHNILKRKNTDSTKPNNKIVHPYATYITDTLSGYLCGEPITYTSTDEDALNELRMILTYSDEAAENMSIARDMSIYGVAYELLYIDADGMTRMVNINPKDIVIIYDDTIEENILYAIRKIPRWDIETDKRYFDIEIYSDTTISYYRTNESFSTFDSVGENTEHYFNDVPIIEFKNNDLKLGDFENIIPLIDSYDLMESDSLNDYEYFVDAYLMLTGVVADSEDIAAMKENRVLMLDEGSKAEWLTKNANDTAIENVKNRIKSDIHKFARVPDLSDEAFAGNASGVAIKYKLYGTETLCSTKERGLMKGLQRRIEIIFNILNLMNNSYDWRSIELQFTRNVPSNETEIADMVQKLASVVSRETLLAQIPFITDVAGEVERIEEQESRMNEEQPFYNLDFERGVEENE